MKFSEWWHNGGSEAWASALDQEGGTLAALEMVYKNGGALKLQHTKSLSRESRVLQQVSTEAEEGTRRMMEPALLLINEILDDNQFTGVVRQFKAVEG